MIYCDRFPMNLSSLKTNLHSCRHHINIRISWQTMSDFVQSSCMQSKFLDKAISADINIVWWCNCADHLIGWSSEIFDPKTKHATWGRYNSHTLYITACCWHIWFNIFVNFEHNTAKRSEGTWVFRISS